MTLLIFSSNSQPFCRLFRWTLIKAKEIENSRFWELPEIFQDQPWWLPNCISIIWSSSVKPHLEYKFIQHNESTYSNSKLCKAVGEVFNGQPLIGLCLGSLKRCKRDTNTIQEQRYLGWQTEPKEPSLEVSAGRRQNALFVVMIGCG